MTDIDGQHRRILTQFGVDQMSGNAAGIGNECTHWVYAALLEARALDFDEDLHISQSNVPYTWGRPVPAEAAQRGDIAQFHGYRNDFFFYTIDASGNYRYLDAKKIRGPNHTGMVFVPPKGGAYFELESHLHDPSTTLMRVRGNTIYYESFAIALSQADLTAQQSSPAWPADVDISNMDAVLERIDWSGMRSKLSTSLAAGDALIPRIRQNPAAPAQLDGKTIAVLFVAHCSGNLKFYCPQASAARLAMNDQQFAAEKAKLMGRCERGGRPGGPADVDEYGGDNKRVRERNDRFNWSFTQH